MNFYLGYKLIVHEKECGMCMREGKEKWEILFNGDIVVLAVKSNFGHKLERNL